MRRIAPLLLLVACGADTGRARTTFELTAAGGDAAYTNAHGWRIELVRAELHVTSIRFFEGAPLFSRLVDAVLPRAYAHPGHYAEGDALAEVLRPHTIDLLGPPVSIGVANGVTGDYASAEVTLTANDAGYVARIAGTAERDGTVVDFSADVEGEAAIGGIGFGAQMDTAGGAVALVVDLTKWLDRADFEGVTDGALAPDAQPRRALERGLVNTAAYVFERVSP